MQMFLAANSTRLDGTIYFWTHASAIQLASEISNPGSGTYAYTVITLLTTHLEGWQILEGSNLLVKLLQDKHFFTTSKTSNAKPCSTILCIPGGNSGVDNSQFFKTNTTNTKHSNTFKRTELVNII
jgi:hypothetical protein